MFRVFHCLSCLIVMTIGAVSVHAQHSDITPESLSAELAARRPHRAYEVEWDLTTVLDPSILNGFAEAMASQQTVPNPPPGQFIPITSSVTTHGHGVGTFAGRADYHVRFISDVFSGPGQKLVKDFDDNEVSFANGQSRSLLRRPEGAFGRIGSESRWKSLTAFRSEVYTLIACLLNPLDLIAPTPVSFQQGEFVRSGLNSLRCQIGLDHESMPGGVARFDLDPSQNWRTLRVELELSGTIVRSDVIYDDAGHLKTIITAGYNDGVYDRYTQTASIKRITPIDPPKKPDSLSIVFPAGAHIQFPTGTTRQAATTEEAERWVKEALRQ